MALTDKLSAIGDAIRAKTGGTELLTLDAMPTEIASITTGDVSREDFIPDEALVITGDCQYRFAYSSWNWFIEKYGNQIITKDITNMGRMFEKNGGIQTIPFDINAKDYTGLNGSSFTTELAYIFNYCSGLIEAPKIIKPTIKNLQGMFEGCHNLRNIPDDYCDTWLGHYITTITDTYGGNASAIFSSCYSLRSYPKNIFTFVNKNITSVYSMFYYRTFYNCYTLDEITNMPLPYTAALTSNALAGTIDTCSRLKRFTFALQDDGTPYIMNWKKQTLDLSKYVGYNQWASDITSYNSGITADKEVKDDATYQALKDDPDWFTVDVNYSRYNHDSAVETINSLPDTSATGGTNTIKFKGASGTNTDGGAISNLTEEEIAVATAKGWTVSLV